MSEDDVRTQERERCAAICWQTIHELYEELKGEKPGAEIAVLYGFGMGICGRIAEKIRGQDDE